MIFDNLTTHDLGEVWLGAGGGLSSPHLDDFVRGTSAVCCGTSIDLEAVPLLPSVDHGVPFIPSHARTCTRHLVISLTLDASAKRAKSNFTGVVLGIRITIVR